MQKLTVGQLDQLYQYRSRFQGGKNGTVREKKRNFTKEQKTTVKLYSLFGKQLGCFLEKLNKLQHNSAFPLLGIYPRGMKM